MKQLFQKWRERREGMIAVEACIGLTLFMMLMLALYSLIPLFMAQSMIGHALTESCQSMALETYGTSKLDDGNMQVKDIPIEIMKLFCSVKSNLSGSEVAEEDREAFVSDSRWFDFEGAEIPDNEKIIAVAEQRFAAYLAGSYSAADEMLEVLGVEDGMEGLDFTGTTLDGKDLIISVQYDISLLVRLDMFDFGVFSAGQKVCSRIWGSA